MLDNRDANSPELDRLLRIRSKAKGTADDLTAYLEAWLDYLPKVYPVASTLGSDGI